MRRHSPLPKFDGLICSRVTECQKEIHVMIANRTRLLLFYFGSRVLKNGQIAIYKSGVKIYRVHEKCVFGTPQNEMKHV